VLLSKIWVKQKEMKQTVEEAAYDYAAQKTKFRKDVLKEVDADDYVSRHSDYMEDFQCGVQWQAKQSPWISVKERLPEEGEHVLIRLKDGIVRLVCYDTDDDVNVCFWSDNYAYETISGWDVTHWTPIPSFDEILEANKDVLERIKEKGD
jgi:hypothetical protein